MTNIVLAGAAGRMGQTIIKCAQDLDDVSIVAAVDYNEHPGIGDDVGSLAGIDPIGVPLSNDLPGALAEADVLIDFTLHNAVPQNVTFAAELRRAVVIGTTGLSEDETATVHSATDKIPVIWAPNMSLGVNLLFAAVKKAASVLGPDYVVDVDETHHIHKKDSPSGTALRLGERVADGLNWDFDKTMVHDPDNPNMQPQSGKIVITSHREGEVVGEHTVSFQNEGERIEFTHHAASRAAFAMGALHAAKWVVTQRAGMYDMQDVLGL